MDPRRLFAATAALMLALIPGRAAACSVTGDYVRPSNFELVAMADAIVVATAEGPATVPADEHSPSGVRFKVTGTLKGQAPATVTFRFAHIGRATPGNPNDLSAANGEAYAGPCNRMTYARGGTYVLLLERDDAGALRPVGMAFSRVNEDYTGENSLWVRTIRLYLEVQKGHDPMAQLTRLETLRGQLLTRTDPVAKAQAADIQDHLTSRSPWKPTAFLIQTWEALDRGETPRYPIRGPQADKELGEAQALTEAMFNMKDGPFGRTEQMNFILRALVLGEHPDAGPFFDRLLARPDVTPAQLGAAIRWRAVNGPVGPAFALIRDRAVPLLVGLDRPATGRLVEDISQAMQGPNYDEGDETWRTDPAVAAAWPPLARRIDRQQRLVMGEGYALGFSGVLEALYPTDYRTDPDLTLLLAGGFDDRVQAWAIEQLKAPRRPDSNAEDEDEDTIDPDQLPIRVLMSGYGDERDAAMQSVFCQGGKRRTLLIRAIGQDGEYLDTAIAARIAAFPPLSDDDRAELVRALALLYAHERGQYGLGAFSSNGDNILELLGKVQRKERPTDFSPFPCAL